MRIRVAVIIAVVVVAVAMIGMAASTALLSSPEAPSQDPQAIAPKVTDESESETLDDTPDYTLLQDGTTVQESMQISKILDAGTGAKWGTITEIVDGDTVRIDAITYRLNLIDTPERGEEGFWEASDALKELCPKDSAILYDEDSITEFDKYGRHLGVIWCKGNNYSATAGEWLSDNDLLKKFYTEYCPTTEAASASWAAAHDNRFYHDVCN